jgi:hypothetical protein
MYISQGLYCRPHAINSFGKKPDAVGVFEKDERRTLNIERPTSNVQ